MMSIKAKRMIARVIVSSRTNKMMKFKQLDYQYRRYLFSAIRNVQNGKFGILNFHIALYIDQAFEEFRATHNQFLDQNLKLFDRYHEDYNHAIKCFQTIDVNYLAALLQQKYDCSMEESVLSFNPDCPNTFVDNFINDVEYSGNGAVDERSSIGMTHSLYSPNIQLSESIFDSPGQLQGFRDLNTNHASLQSLKSSKFLSKLYYLLSKVKKMEFKKLNKKDVKSRVIILCLSGFLSEDEDKAYEWKDVVNYYPHNEILSINWSASSIIRTVGEVAKGVGKAFGPVTRTTIEVGDKIMGATTEYGHDKKKKQFKMEVQADIEDAIQYQKLAEVRGINLKDQKFTEEELDLLEESVMMEQGMQNPFEAENAGINVIVEESNEGSLTSNPSIQITEEMTEGGNQICSRNQNSISPTKQRQDLIKEPEQDGSGALQSIGNFFKSLITFDRVKTVNYCLLQIAVSKLFSFNLKYLLTPLS